MYNLPYISYGIFAFVVVAIGLLAWKKGFKAAFASFVLTLATIGAIVGAVYGLYEYISPIFRDYIKSHFGGAQGFDFSFIANEARPQVMAICIAIGFIPVFGLLFGISYPLYRFLKKRDFPRLAKKISPNSKKIKLQNKKLNKIGAIAATSVTAVATGAVISTATSAALTTSGSFNIFNKISSYISQGTTFGFGFDSVALHKMYDFIPLTNDAVLMKTFGKILMPSSKEPLTKTEVELLQKDANLYKLIELLEDSQTEALLSVVGSALNSSEDIDYVSFKDKLQQRDSLWRPLGNESSNTQYVHTIQEIEKSYTDAGVQLHIEVQTVNKIIEWVRNNGIQKFESTEAFAKWQQGQSVLEQLKENRNEILKDIYKKNTELSGARSFFNTEVSKRESAKNEFISNINKFNNLNNATGLIKQQTDVVDNKTTFRDVKQQEFTKADTDWSHYRDNELKTAQKAYDDAKQTYDKSVVDRDIAQNELNQANRDLKAQEDIISNTNNQINNTNELIRNLKNEQKTLRDNLSTLTTNETNTKNVYTSTQQSEQTYQTTLSTEQGKLNGLTNELSSLKVDVDSAKATLNQLNNELTQLKTDLSKETDANAIKDINARISAKNNEITAQNTLIQDKQSLVNNKQGEVTAQTKVRDNAQTNLNNARTATTNAKANWDKAKTELDNANNRITAIDGELRANNSTLNTLGSTLNTATTERDRIKNNVIPSKTSTLNSAESKVKTDKIPFDDRTRDLSNAQNEFNRLAGVKDTASTNLQNANNDLANAEAELSRLKNDRDNLNTSITNFSSLNDSNNANVFDANASVKAIEWKASSFDTEQLNLSNSSDFSSAQQFGFTFNNPTFTTSTVTKDLITDFSKKYEDSLPYLTNTNGTPLPKVDDPEAKHDDGTPVQSVDISVTPPEFGKWGKLEAINFNISEGSQSVKFLEIAKNNKLNEFNKNIEDYLHILESHLK